MVSRSIGSVSLQLSSDGSNPDGRESHSLNVVQLQYSQYYPVYTENGVNTWFSMPFQVPPQYF